MSALRTAIFNKFKADSNAPLYADLSGTRLYFYEAIQNVVMPYCVFSFINEDYDFEFSEIFEETVVQFDYFSNKQSPDECDDGAADIKTMFDFTNLTVTGDTFLQMVRSFSIPAQKIQPDNLWQAIVRYDLLVQT